MATKRGSDTVWTREYILQVENRVLQDLMAARTFEAVESCVAYARFLKMSGLTSENYALFVKMLEIENHWVLDALIGDQDPFLLLSAIPPNRHLVSNCFKLLTKWRPGGIYPKTLAIVLGVLQNAYSSPKDGYKIYPLGIADVHNLGTGGSPKQMHPRDPRKDRLARRPPLGRFAGGCRKTGNEDQKLLLR
jgi:hypothetical protein